MRRAVIVEKSLVVEADSIDDERIALVMADRFSVPGGFWIDGVRGIQPDVPLFIVSRKDHRDLPRRLQDEQSTPEQHVEARNAARLAGGTRREGELPGEHFVIVLLHHIFRPLLQIGVADVANALGRLLSGDARYVIRNVAMGRVLTDRRWRAWNRKECADAEAPPSGLGGKGKNRRRARCHSLLSCRRPGEACQEPERDHLPLPARFAQIFLLVW